MAERKFLDFLDRIDGGGAGAMGDEFEGGGLLSLLGNLLASPYGSQDERRGDARRAFYEGQSGMDAPMPTTTGGLAPTAASLASPYSEPAPVYSPQTGFSFQPKVDMRPAPGMSYIDPNMPTPLGADGNYVPPPAVPVRADPGVSYVNPNMPTPLDASGGYVPPPMAPAPTPAYTPHSSMGVPVPQGLSFDQFVAGLGPIAQTASPDALRQAYVQHMQQYAY